MAKQMMDIGVVSVLDVDGNEIGIDLQVVNGDFVIVESSDRHGVELLEGGNGDFKDNPTCCVDITDFQDEGGNGSRLMNTISTKFTADGVDVQQVALVDGVTVIRGYYV